MSEAHEIREPRRPTVNDVRTLTRGDRAGAAATGAKIGAVLGAIAGLLTGLDVLTIPGLAAVGTGWLAAVAAGTVAGALVGGALGIISRTGVSGEEADAFAERMRGGPCC